jgi:hypothetical protein
MNRIGAERGWQPITRGHFDREAGPDGSLYVGSPETVAKKIAATYQALGLTRFHMKYSNGTLPHQAQMTSLELYGTKVAPRVRELLDTGGYTAGELVQASSLKLNGTQAALRISWNPSAARQLVDPRQHLKALQAQVPPPAPHSDTGDRAKALRAPRPGAPDRSGVFLPPSLCGMCCSTSHAPAALAPPLHLPAKRVASKETHERINSARDKWIDHCIAATRAALAAASEAPEQRSPSWIALDPDESNVASLAELADLRRRFARRPFAYGPPRCLLRRRRHRVVARTSATRRQALSSRQQPCEQPPARSPASSQRDCGAHHDVAARPDFVPDLPHSGHTRGAPATPSVPLTSAPAGVPDSRGDRALSLPTPLSQFRRGHPTPTEPPRPDRVGAPAAATTPIGAPSDQQLVEDALRYRRLTDG